MRTHLETAKSSGIDAFALPLNRWLFLAWQGGGGDSSEGAKEVKKVETPKCDG